MRAALAILLLTLPACSAFLDFDQCSVDDDCLPYAGNGAPAWCTADHICVSDFPSDRLCAVDAVSSQRPDAITIGGLFRLSGPSASEDTDRARAVKLAVKEINLADKRALRLVLCDTGGDPERARKAYAYAADAFSVIAFVGPSTSSEVVALARTGDNLLKAKGALVVSPSATAPAITALDDDGLVWRTAASDNLQGRVLASQVSSAATKVASAYVSSTYGSGLNGAFTDALGTRMPPLQPVAKGFAQGTAGSEVASFLAQQSPEVALVVADVDAPSWLTALGGGGAALDTTNFLFTDGAKSPALLTASPSASLLDRIAGTAPATPNGPAFNAFQSVYMGEYGTNPANTAFVANAYDATYAIALAMAPVYPPEAGIPSGRFLLKGMGWLSDQNGATVRVGAADFASAYSPFADGTRIDLEGTSGPIDFDSDTGDVSSAPIEYWDIDTSVTPPVFRTVKIVTP